MVRKKIRKAPVVVIGLGRLGTSLARELVTHGVEVLGIDIDEKQVRACADFLTDVVQADTSDPEVLRQLGVDEVSCVVVAIGSHLEGSVLTTSNILDLGIKDVWAKADSDAHARILKKLGVQHIVRPERDTGKRVAHLLGGRFEDFMEIAENYGVTTMVAPEDVDPVTMWKELRVQLISVKTAEGWVPVNGPVKMGTKMMVAGTPMALERFSAGS